MTSPQELPKLVAQAADSAGSHATAPTMLLELHALVGWLSGIAFEATEHGRRPFRVTPAWRQAIGAAGFALFNIADQTGVDVNQAIADHAHAVLAAHSGRAPQDTDWPFSGS